jgi:hypothetical protein
MQAPVMREGKDFTISKPWVGLTDEQIDFVYKTANPFVPRENVIQIAKAIEAKLKEKNT